MKEMYDPVVPDKRRMIEKLRTIRALSMELAEEEIPQVQNNMDATLALVNELLFLLDDDYERP